MAFSSKGRGVIRLHDTTSHGGKVIKVAHQPTDDGLPVACKGDLVECPKCNGVYRIIEGDENSTIHGVPIAYEGHKTECGAALISSVGKK